MEFKCIHRLGMRCLGNAGRSHQLQTCHFREHWSGREGTAWWDCCFTLGSLTTSLGVAELTPRRDANR